MGFGDDFWDSTQSGFFTRTTLIEGFSGKTVKNMSVSAYLIGIKWGVDSSRVSRRKRETACFFFDSWHDNRIRPRRKIATKKGRRSTFVLRQPFYKGERMQGQHWTKGNFLRAFDSGKHACLGQSFRTFTFWEKMQAQTALRKWHENRWPWEITSAIRTE